MLTLIVAGDVDSKSTQFIAYRSSFHVVYRRKPVSHIVTISTEIRDDEALRLACRRLALPEPTHRTVHLFTRDVIGLAVELPGWSYPVVCDLESSQVHYDNYGGAWGEQQQLSRLLQAYAVEKAKLEARRKGFAVMEQPLADGSIKLTIQVTGAAA